MSEQNGANNNEKPTTHPGAPGAGDAGAQGGRPTPQQGAPAQETGAPGQAPSAAAKPNPRDLNEMAEAALNDPVLIAEAEARRLEAEVADLTDQLARSHAEMQNMRRRHEKDQEDMAKYAIRKFAKDIVGVADNFTRATESVKAEDAENNAVVKGLLDGVSMTEREFINVLERHGIKRIDAAGEPFDPHKHQAMMEQEDLNKPSGTVLQVFQAGYEIAEQVLRPAMVIVSKGGPKAPKPEVSQPKPKRPILRMPHEDEEPDFDDEGDEDDGAPPPIDQM